MKDRYQNRLFYARLARYSYSSSNDDLSGIKYLDEFIIASIRFCYFLDESEGCRYLAIRGTDNIENVVVDIALLGALGLLTPGMGGIGVSIAGKIGVEALLESITRTALIVLEGKYGKCSAATGHSLGGRALEFLPERIGCVAFNALQNKNCPHVSSVRMHGDLAGQHTDHWIGSEGMVIVPVEAHKLDNIIKVLESPGCSARLYSQPQKQASVDDQVKTWVKEKLMLPGVFGKLF